MRLNEIYALTQARSWAVEGALEAPWFERRFHFYEEKRDFASWVHLKEKLLYPVALMQLFRCVQDAAVKEKKI